MNVYSKYLEEASRTFKIADHMLSVTYPLVQDTKLLLAILQNLFITLDSSITALVHQERFYKKIPPFQDNFESRYNTFSMRCVKKYDIQQFELINEIKELIELHQNSPVEFIREDKLVICSDKYNLKTLNIENIREYITATKQFMSQVQTIIKENNNEIQ